VAQATYVTSQQPSLTYCYGTYTRIALKNKSVVI